MTLDEIRSGTLQKLHLGLVAHQRRFLVGGEMEKTVEGLIAANGDSESLRVAFNERFGTKLTKRDFEIEVETDAKDTRIVTQPASPEQVRQLLLDRARQVLREELTDLEQFVLIQILDQSWKDHLYAMDMMKNGIGLLAFAEQDPRMQYKKEGFRYFQEMMARRARQGDGLDLPCPSRRGNADAQRVQGNHRGPRGSHRLRRCRKCG